MEEKVESFTLDHRKVVAPYVRKCCTLEGEKGDKVSKYDLRFTQPNVESIPTAALHAIEHLLAHHIREHIDGVIDLSPMGCRTGFYLSLWGEKSVEDVRNALVLSLQDVMNAEEIPAANAIQCGNYRDLSLFGAKEYARKVLHERISTSIYGEDR